MTVIKRMKSQCCEAFQPRRFFWRTAEQNEVDYLEEATEGLQAWEFKWSHKKRQRKEREGGGPGVVWLTISPTSVVNPLVGRQAGTESLSPPAGLPRRSGDRQPTTGMLQSCPFSFPREGGDTI